MAQAKRGTQAQAPAKFDPTAFGVEEASADELVGKRSSKYDNHAWVPIMTDSYENGTVDSNGVQRGKGKAFNPVPAAQLDDVKRDLNGVAKALGVGVKIKAEDNGDGTYRVLFRAQDRRKVERKPLTAEQKAARNATREANKRAKASS